ncbi:Patched domain-containing protein 3 [Trichinella murrelli]|uniref:Patched domain-containing protein 3 n=1 Tax=Trichinella murrelli TaxID=144512 RepID=A0A0V0UB01_9BILA|nr:Patched domain-containing protein 3 [Trichinella murrelli]
MMLDKVDEQSSSPQTGEKCLDYLERLFQRHGELVGRHPAIFLIAPLLVAGMLSIGVVNVQMADDMRQLYTPPGSVSLDEYRQHSQFLSDGNYSTSGVFYIGIARRDGGNLLQLNYANFIDQLNQFVLNNLTFNFEGKLLSFNRDVCSKSISCTKSNEVFRLIVDAYFNPRLTSNADVKLTYPVASIFGNRMFLGGLFGGVQTDPAQGGRISSVSMIHLIYQYPTFERQKLVDSFEKAVRDHLATLVLEDPWNDNLEFHTYSSSTLKDEVSRTTLYALPYFPISVLLLTALLVSVLCTGDSTTSKPLEGLAGLVNSLLAIAAAFGLVAAVGVPYNSTVTVVPFITLALAVDDTFILLAAWHQTDRRLGPASRLGLCLKEAGPAITVTVSTDVFSFLIGVFSSTPAVSSFCIYTVAAILFDYIFQLTFFCAVAAYGGRREASSRHCLFYWKTVDKRTTTTTAPARINPVQRILSKLYAQFWQWPASRLFVLVIYAVYLVVSLYGASTIRVNLTPENLLVTNSPLKRYIWLAEQYIYPQGFSADVYILNAPDMRNRTQLKRVQQFVDELEHSRFAVGHDSTSFWLEPFQRYMQHLGADDDEFYDYLSDFVHLSSNERWTRHLRFDQRPGRRHLLTQFSFTTGFKITDWVSRSDMVVQWRQLCDRYADLKPVVYDEYNFIADQVVSLKTTTLQEVGVAFCCMGLVCALFIRQRDVLFWVLWSLFSMDLGVIGLLALWNLDMDPTLVVSVLMSIGLTVDFTIHMAYHYHRHHEQCWMKRMLALFDVAGWPLIEGGLCTLLAMLSLVFVSSHVASVFLRTVLLVVILGLFHSLIVLPALFTLTHWPEKLSTVSSLVSITSGQKRQYKQQQQQKRQSPRLSNTVQSKNELVETHYIQTLEQEVDFLELENSLKSELEKDPTGCDVKKEKTRKCQVNVKSGEANVEALLDENEQLKKQLAHRNLSEEVVELRKKLDDTVPDISCREAELAQLRIEVEEGKQKLAQATRMMAFFKAQCKSDSQNGNVMLCRKHGDKQAQVEKLTNELKLLECRMRELNERYQQSQDEKLAMKKQLRQAELQAKKDRLIAEKVIEENENLIQENSQLQVTVSKMLLQTDTNFPIVGDEKCQSELVQIKENEQLLRAELISRENALHDAHVEQRRLCCQIEDLESTQRTLKQSQGKLYDQIESLQSASRVLSDENKQLRQEILGLETSIETHLANIQQQGEEIKTLRNRLSAYEQQKKIISAKLRNAQQEHREKFLQLNQLATEFRQISQSLYNDTSPARYLAECEDNNSKKE